MGLAIGRVRPGGHPHSGGGGTLPNGALGCPLAGSLSRRGHITTIRLPFPALSPPCGERIVFPPTLHPIPP